MAVGETEALSTQTRMLEVSNSTSADTPGGGAAGQARRTPLWTLKAYQFLGTAAWACCFRFIGVYYDDIGLSRSQVGFITLLRRSASFFGLLFWARMCDYLGEYKRVLVTCNSVGIATTLCLLLPVVQSSFALVMLATAIGAFFGSACSSGVIDALCNKVLEQHGGRESYGNQRLWSSLAAALLALGVGAMVDLFGIPVMFLGYALFSCTNLLIMCRYLPSPDLEATNELRRRRKERRCDAGFRRFDVLWFFSNLLVYGVCMSMVEAFLFIYLLQDFEDTPAFLVGAAVTVMCACEVPVFKWFHLVTDGDRPRMSLRAVLVACHAILALRCVLYAVLPTKRPWLVLLIEPLHGLTFAAMWSSAVKYGKELSTPGQEATMQAFVTGLYYQLADGFGSMLWGRLSEQPPKGFGFRLCYASDAALVAAWSVVWSGGWLLHRRCKVGRAEHDADSAAAGST